MCNKCGIRPRVFYKNSHKTYCKECSNEYQNKRNAKIRLGVWKPKQTKRIPRSPVVYTYFTLTGQCIYVGRGTIRRARNHRAISSWWNTNLILITMTCSDEWESMEYEGKWGARYRPLMNKDGYRYN